MERFEFKSETKELLQMMAHSLYSSKDVCLRELISNASDALDRRRFEAVKDPSKLDASETLEIKISADKENRTLVVEDNGDGMTREELISNLGTIAHSGTKAFVENLKKANPNEQSSLIGQFGVGFYSVFILADNVTVETKRVGQDKAYIFKSTGDGSYTIEETEKAGFGTRITMNLRPSDAEDNLEDFTNEWTIKQTVKKYSDFVQYPVMVLCEHKHHREGVEEAEGHDVSTCNDPTHQVTEKKWEQANSMKAIWLKSDKEVTDEEYNDFYKTLTYDYQDPLLRININAEGNMEFKGLVFIPSKAPFDMNYRDTKYGLRLYAQHVLIMDKCQELVPDYLRFLKGVVDSSDLNLNLSREILQKDKMIGRIRKHVVKKILDALENLKTNDPDKYMTFWENYSRVIKEGAASDYDNKDRLLKLMKFISTYTVSEDEKQASDAKDTENGETKKASKSQTTFEEYIARMPEDQKDIYAITGESLEVVRNSPHLEAFLQKGYEVLYLIDPYDEILFANVPEVQGKKIVFIGRGEVELGSEEEKKEQREKLESQKKDYNALMDALKDKLSNEIESVRLSSRLTTSPACLVSQEGDMSPQLQRLISKMGHNNMPQTKRILEINPNHPLLQKLLTKFGANDKDPMIGKYAQLLYGQSLLAEGSPLPDPVEYTKLVTELMVGSL
ncbi:MAG: molecular chaperone HtpG [Proteobacteria bacterium]|nr:molecular chaperone HtpG [Pseudomonadota bacterium]